MSLQTSYIQLLKNSLLNEIYLENEVRLLYIFSRLQSRQQIDIDVVREIGSKLPDVMQRVKAARQMGTPYSSPPTESLRPRTSIRSSALTRSGTSHR